MGALSAQVRGSWPVCFLACLVLGLGCDSNSSAPPPDAGTAQADQAAGGPPPPPIVRTPAADDASQDSGGARVRSAVGSALGSIAAAATGKDEQEHQVRQSLTNLKQLMLAMHNYHDVYKAFPATHSVNQAGEPLLSWRVHLLPYLGQLQLYNQFHLDEPWDSEYNLSLLRHMPEIYQAPGSNAAEGKTVYLGNAGERGIFVAPKDARTPIGTRIRDIMDGTSNTIALVQADDALAVEWTRPSAEYVPPAGNPAQGLGVVGGYILTALCDGSTRPFKQEDLNADLLQTLGAMFTRNGTELISF